MKIHFALLIALVGCGQAVKKTDTAQVSASVENTAPQLTEAQIAEGWKILFDGKSLDGWRTYKNKEVNSWEIIDGTLHCMPFDSASQRADLITIDQYENFELAFEWKIGPQGNSGVMYRVTEAYDEPYLSGPEYQLLDDVGYPGETKDVNSSGSNYDMHAPQNKKLNPAGEWNTSKIVVNGNLVEHWLNGEKVVDYEFGSADWKQRKEASKWKDEKGYGMATKGHIDLQDHGGEVWLRNIFIRIL